MRKIIGWMLIGCLAIAAIPGLAQGEAAGADRRRITYPGTVVAGKEVAVIAPFGGVLSASGLKQGSVVAAGDTLFTIETTKVYAPCDGVVGRLSGQPGDEITFLQDRYSAMLVIEPSGRYTIDTDTRSAYDDAQNKIIHVGEPVYLKSRSDSDRVGTGFVTSVNGSRYTVEVTGGNLELSDSVTLYRSAEYTTESKIGVGKTARMADVPIQGSGVLFTWHVTHGQAVRRGDLLFETVSGSALLNLALSEHISADADAVVASVAVSDGASVTQGQTLATLYRLGDLRIAIDVSEIDLFGIRIGDSVQIALANIPGQAPFTGTVVSIAGLNSGTESDPTYTVDVSFDCPVQLLPGMNVNVSFDN